VIEGANLGDNAGQSGTDDGLVEGSEQEGESRRQKVSASRTREAVTLRQVRLLS